jgi:hypothetical protein
VRSAGRWSGRKRLPRVSRIASYCLTGAKALRAHAHAVAELSQRAANGKLDCIPVSEFIRLAGSREVVVGRRVRPNNSG